MFENATWFVFCQVDILIDLMFHTWMYVCFCLSGLVTYPNIGIWPLNLLYLIFCDYMCIGYWCLTPHSTIFQLFRGFSFIGEGNRSTRRKPPTCASKRQTLPHNVVPWAGFEFTILVVICTIYVYKN